ncbi:Jrk helix-turn-helix protein [Chelydra serpentina]|uniref:Jrk helix-turn-helix protein n=1 Tax=Chelydra serpentina TaxID=8475 RepID=A0A8T1SIM6_CHESE|nr:Jrk helix-turn-helix protein [Chelydra serpentina]
MLPDRTLATKTDSHKREGFKQRKDQVTLLFCVNKSGSHKLRPLMIEKARSPRCFHHVNMKALPFEYTNSKNAWMNRSIFEGWFHKTFVPAVRAHLRKLKQEGKALLLLDNCPAHPPSGKSFQS